MWLDQVNDFIAEDVAALGCATEIARLDRILAEGTSADRQIGIYTGTKAAGRRRLTAIKETVDWVTKTTQAVG